MKRTIGLRGVVVTLIGYVIGASIFILPGELAGSAGPAVVISYSLAAVIAAFSCVAAAQLGAAFPETGAGFVSVARVLSPFAGFMGIWMMLAAYIMAIALIAIGFADYFTATFPAVPHTVAVYGVVVIFMLLNMGNIQLLVGVQSLLVVLFMVALALVSGGGLTAVESQNLMPFAPKGWNPVLFAVVPAFFSYGGFMCVMEIAGEIREPGRTIPIGMAVSFLLVLVTYVALALVLVGVIPWQDLATTKAPVRVVAEQLFPGWGGLFISLAVIGAAATSINALVLVASRDIIALARARILPAVLAHEEGGKPHASVALVGVLSVIALLFGSTITDYAVWVSSFTLLFQVLVGLALLRLPTRAEQEYRAAGFALGRRGLALCGWGLIAISAAFLALVVSEMAATLFGAGAYLLLGFALFRTRKSTEETTA